VFALGKDTAGYTANHYSAWLDYAYLQQGRLAKARSLLETARRNLGAPPKMHFRWALLGMRAHYLVASEQWADSSIGWGLDTTGVGPVTQAMDAFALGYAALKRGDRATADVHQRRLGDLAARKAKPDEDDGDIQVAAILDKELRAATSAADGKGDEAVATLRDAVAQEEAIPAAFGPPDVVKPPAELLGELLLAQGKPAEAQQAFTRSLALAPRRSLSLLGQARSATAAGDTVVAEQAYADLRAIWKQADTDVARLLAQAN
jgi:tetratricopeptide (TPR) repeat protein